MVIQVDQDAVNSYKQWQAVDAANRSYGRDDYLPSSNPNSPHKRNNSIPKKKNWGKPSESSKVGDWLGSPNKAKRTWKVKEVKSAYQIAQEEKDQESTATPSVVPNLDDGVEDDTVEISAVEDADYEDFETVHSNTTGISSAAQVPPSLLVLKEHTVSEDADDVSSVPSMFQSAVANRKPLKIAATPVVEPSDDEESVVEEEVIEDDDDDDDDDSSSAVSPVIELRPEEYIIKPEDNIVQSYLNSHVDTDDDDDDEDDEYKQAMKAKTANFLSDTGYADSDEEEGTVDYETERARKAKEVVVPEYLPDNALDHIVLGTHNLVEGMELFESLTGVKATKLGTLRGAGTKSARAKLDDELFVEIVGPDDSKTPFGMGEELSGLPAGKLVPYHYAVRNPPTAVSIPSYLSWDRDEIIMVHASPEDYDEDGDVHKWDFLLLYGHALGGVVPAFVNWREKKYHPTAGLKQTGLSLNYLKIRAPEGNYVHDLMDDVENVLMTEGTPAITLSLNTPKGEVTFSADHPEGLVMPGFGDPNHPSMRSRTMEKVEQLPISAQGQAL